MSDTENVAPCNFLAKGIGYFEVQGTPPDERKRRERMASLAAAQEAGILLLTPFAASPRLEFDRIKLGQSGVRRLIVRNPGDKALDVRLEKLPKEEKGFNVDFVAFRLGGREETTLLVGWTPVKGGGVRDSFIVKFGKFSAQVILIGSCLAPEEKKAIRGASKPRPLGPKNSSGGKRPSLASSKLHAAAPKITIPANPVVRKNHSPEKHLMEGMSPPKEQPQVVTRQPQDFVCGGEVRSLEISRAEVVAYDLRRETYVHERPEPRGGDILSSTPIHPQRDLPLGECPPSVLRRETFIPESSQKLFAPESDMGAMLPPADPRRQTYIPEKKSSTSNALPLPTVLPQQSRTLKRSPGNVKLPSVDESVAESWTPQKPWEREEEEKAVRRTWESGKQLEPASMATPDISGVESLQLEVGELSLEEAQDLSLSPKKSLAPDDKKKKEPALSAVLAKMMDASLSEPLNLSLKNQGKILDTSTPDVNKEETEETLAIPEVSKLPQTPARYMPRVSDISQATDVASPNIGCASPSSKATPSLPLRDLRLKQLMQDEDVGKGALDLSTGSLLADCSMAVHLATPAKRREDDVDQELLEVEERSSSWQEDEELEQLALARATSAAAVHADDVGPTFLEVEQSEWRLVEEQEICTTEVVEEVVEYEYQIVDGQRKLVDERKVGGSISSQQEVITRTPVKTVRHTTHTLQVSGSRGGSENNPATCGLLSEEEKPEFIHIPLSPNPKLRPRSVDLTTDCAEPLTPLLSSQSLKVLDEDLVNPSVCRSRVLDEEDLRLPGLRGSPRVSHQVASGQSFLQATIGDASFLPPDPEDPRRCSTGVKTKGGTSIIGNSTEEVRKSLQFGDSEQNSEDEEKENMPSREDSSHFAPVNSLGFQLPVIKTQEEEEADNCRLSSDTFVTSPAPPALSTIQEERTSLMTVGRSELGSESSQHGVKDTFEKRTPARPRRSTISYTTQNIEDITTSPDEVKEGEVEGDGKASTGLMFFPISPDQGKGEKRKSEEGIGNKKISQDTKRLRVPEPRTVSAKAPTVRASKNPAPPRSLKALNSSQLSKTGPRVKAVETKPQTMPQRRSAALKVPSQPMRRLQLGGKKQSMVHRPNPFASRNMYYDDKWVEKQERGFTRWLNFMLTPQSLEEETSMVPGVVDVAKLWSQCTKDVRVPRAPTREVLSLRAYTARREMNRLRRNACKLWQSSHVASVVTRLELEIDKLRLVIRKDRNFNKDVGMKQKLLQLLLSYNPLWLRIGLETIYGELISLGNNSDVLGLSRFLVTRLLSNPEILAEWAHPSVPHSYRDGHQDALNRFALKKFLELVYFLDAAKEARMIRMNPCLFCPDSELKSSREMLLTFSKEFLQGEGDVTKHLAYMGFTVKHKQTKLDEFDYAVTNFRTDLRCGIRLARVAELLTGSVLAAQMRVPAISRTQKVHNTEVAVSAYKDGGFDVPPSITAKDLVDGHQEKTLQFLWSIIFGHSLSQVLDVSKLKEEIVHLRRSLRARAALGESVALAGQKWLQEMASRSPGSQKKGAELGETVALLLQWAQLVTAHHGAYVENWTVSWADGRSLCLLVNHYQPALLEAAEIQHQTTLTHQADEENLDDSLDFNYGSQKVDANAYNEFLENEKSNFRLLINKVTELGGVPILIKAGDMSNTIPDEKVTATFVGYLAARLLDLSREIKAARIIQVQTAAARKIQWLVRRFLARRRVERYNAAALVLQAAFRGALGRRKAREARWMKREEQILASVLLCQAVWRGRIARRQVEKRKHALVVLQASVRGWMVRRRQKEMKRAVVVLQRRWRAIVAGKRVRAEMAEKEEACVRLQAAARMMLCVRRYKKIKKSTVVLQAWARMVQERRRFVELRRCVVLCQARVRAMAEGRKSRSELLQMRLAAIKVQSWVRMLQSRRQFLRLRQAVVTAQRFGRGALVRRREAKRQQAALCIQAWWRGLLAGWHQRRRFLQARTGIVLLQSLVRARQQQSRYLALRNAVFTVQKRRRQAVLGRQERSQFLKLRSAAIVLQARWRGVQARRAHSYVIDILVTLQARVRGMVVRRRYTALRRAACTIQMHWRSRQLGEEQRRKYNEQKRATVVLQGWWRMVKQRKEYKKEVARVVFLQALTRGLVQKRRFIKIKEAAEVIQKRIRATQQMKVQRSDFLKMQRSALLIQSTYRMVKVRRDYKNTIANVVKCQSTVRAFLMRRQYLRLKVATCKIQQRLREYRAAKCQRVEFLAQKRAAVALQSWWRMIQQRNVYKREVARVVRCQALVKQRLQRQKYLKMKLATLIIQKRFRDWKEMRNERQRFLECKSAVILLQSRWRTVRQERLYKEEVAKVVKCQAVVRGFLDRRCYHIIRNAAVVLQQRFRLCIAMRRERNEYLAQKNAALKLQSYWRMVKQRSKYQEDVKRVVKCQAAVRQVLERQRFLKIKAGATLIQRRFRDYQEMLRVRSRFVAEKKAAVKLQSLWRMVKQRREYRKVVVVVVKCQALIKAKIQKQRFTLLKRATAIIQAGYRNHKRMLHDRAEYQEKRWAAVILQSSWRALRQKRTYREERRKVVKCQATAKKYLARRRYLQLKEAASIIQQRYRRNLQVKEDRDRFLKTKSATVLIQSWWRMVRDRQQFFTVLRASIICQSSIRAFLARRRFLKMKKASQVLQMRWRATQKTQATRREYLMLRVATLTLQARWRGQLARRKYKVDMEKVVRCQALIRGKVQRINFIKSKIAAGVIQKRFRDYVEMRGIREAFLAKRRATLCIQAWWRMTKQRQDYLSLRNASIICQSALRMVKERKRFIEIKTAAISLQRQWRSRMEVKEAREKFMAVKKSVTLIQAHVRGRQVRERYLRQLTAVGLIQRQTRGWLCRRKIEALRREKKREAAATKLQAWLRGCQERRRYTRMLRCCVTIQQWRRQTVKARLQRQNYVQLRAAVLVVQTRRRGTVARRAFLKQKSASVVIQAQVRRILSQASFVRMKVASVLLQRWWRAGQEMRKQRDQFAALRMAAITAQRLWRGKVVREEQRKRQIAATSLQACVRGWLARRWVARKREALLAMQRAARRMAEARRERARFLQIKNTVVALQARARGVQARKSFARLVEDKEYREQLRLEEKKREEAKREAASHVVVRTVRTLIIRKRFLRIRAAATTIQATWRGRQSRIELRTRWKLMASKLKQLQEVRAKLESATASARPEQRLGARTHSAIAYIFDIHDVAQLISAVKTLDLATRLSLHCCWQMAQGEGPNSPVAALVSLLKRCNRSVPHMEVVSTTLDILLNLARLEETRDAVANVVDLLPDLLQAMLVYRDNGKDIFPKCCAVLQTLAVCPKVLASLRTPTLAKTLVSHESLVIKKNKKKEESKRRSSVNMHSMPAPLTTSGRKPLRNLNSSQLNRTYTAPTPAPRTTRKNSTDLATGPPWNGSKDLPRHHEDPVKAILALNKVIGIASS